ncbi:MAG: hypothetical protein AB7S26_32015 [Sandaracinaceae bacterium]
MKTLKRILLGLVVGLLAGLAGGWFGYQRFAPQLLGQGVDVTGVVEARRATDERVQWMLRSPDGETLLATFTERPADVAAIARVGDTVTLHLPEATPFADEPRVVRIVPAEGERPDPFADEVVPEPSTETDDADEAEGDPPEGDGAEPTTDEPEAPAAPPRGSILRTPSEVRRRPAQTSSRTPSAPAPDGAV